MKSADDAKALKRLAQAVRHARTSAAMTQEDVAFTAAVSVRHYQELESGRLNPSFLCFLVTVPRFVDDAEGIRLVVLSSTD